MRKKLILFLMLALFGSANFLRADVIEIGDGTGTTYMVPFNSLYGYSFTEQVFLASEIGMAGNITSISFHISQAYTSAQTNQYTVWMKNVARETFATTTDYEPVTAADKVFEGTWEIPVCQTGDWITLTLDTPFAYDGTSNLLFAMHESTSGYSTRYFYCTSVTNSGISYYSDSNNPDPYNLGSYSGSKVLRSNRNNIQLDITAGGGGGTAAELTVHDGTSTSSYVPVYGFYADAYLKCEMVYPAAELAAMNGGSINSMKFYASSPASEAWTGTWQVFVSEVADATISAFAGPGTVVYEGLLDGTQSEMEIAFNAPYTYHGGNLLVGVYETVTGNYKSVYWYGETVTGASVQGYSYSDLASVSPTQRNFLPKTTFGYTTAGGGGITEPWAPDPDMPLGTIVFVEPENGQQNVTPTVLRWTNAENASQYKVEFGTVYGNLDMLVDWTDATGWDGTLTLADYDITIAPNTRYYWRVYNQNNTGEISELASFVGMMTTASNVRVIPDEIFTDESTLVKWSISGGSVGGSLVDVHIGGDGTTTNSYLPSYSFYNYSLTQQIYTAEEIGGAGAINTIAFYNGGTEKTRTYDMYLVHTSKTSFSGSNDWITGVTVDDKVFTGSVTMAANTWTTFELETPFNYNGSDNLALIMDDNTGSYSSGMACRVFSASNQAIRIYSDGTNYDPFNPTSYSGTVMTEKNQININSSAKGNRDLLGCNVYVDSVKMNTTPITERQYNLTMAHLAEMGVDLYTGSENSHKVQISGVYDYGESNYTAPVDLFVSGYGKVIVTAKELMTTATLGNVALTLVGTDEFGNTVNYEGTTANNGQYTFNNVKVGEYRLIASKDGYDTGMEDVVVVYTQTTNVTIYLHENYTPVFKVYAEEGTLMGNTVADVIWSFSDFTINTGGNGGGAGSSFTEGFEGGMPAGWNVIDGNNDGYTWCMTSAIPSTWSYYASLTLDWYRTGTNAICSGSYINGVGAISPNEYLVTNQVNLGAGSTFSFWAAATDASYPADHFGVCVSDNGTGDWTMVQEWTLTAKSGGADGGMASREGNGAKLGSWHQYTVDLSAYAGQKYIAIRHFNCNDQYIMCVDDIELSGAKSNRNRDLVTIGEGGTGTTGYLPTYNLYNYSLTQQIYTATEIGTMGMINSVAFNVSNNSDTRNIDIYMVNTTKESFSGATDWITVTAADKVFSGVVTITPGGWFTINLDSPFLYTGGNLALIVDDNTGTWTSSIQYYTFDAPSQAIRIYQDAAPYNPLAPTAYSGTVMNVKNQLQLDMVSGGGAGTQLETENHYFMVYRKTVLAEDMSGDLEVLLADEYGMDFADTVYTDQTYGALADGIYQYGVSAVYPFIQRSDNNITEIKWSNKLSKNMKGQLTVNVINATGESVEGTAVALANINEENISYSGEIDETGVMVIDNFEKGDYNLTVNLSGYSAFINNTLIGADGYDINLWGDTTAITVSLEEVLAPVNNLYVSSTGFATWTDMLPHDRYAQRYHVLCDGIFQGDTEDNYMFLNTENLVPGETYEAQVAVIYTTGMSPFVNATFTYQECDFVETQVDPDSLAASVDLAEVTLTWASGNTTPTPPPTGATTFTEGFEGGLPEGWTVVDANNDGWTWCLTSAIPSTWTYYASLTLDWYRTGTNAICSGSYINGVGALTPDEYLKSPLLTLANGSTFSFWAAATDASYPADHFGVFVSADGNTWTSVQEWTLTAKSGGADGGLASRNGNGAKLGSWYNFSVDLSAHAGQKYIAIRHFNCNDQYIMCVDDMELTVPTKGEYIAETADECGYNVAGAPARDMWDLMMTFTAAEGGQYGVAYDGNNFYTSNWGYSAATHNFYKYDLEGNMIEGFDISNCGTLRGMTYDGEYFYGVANSSTVYCVDLANHSVVNTFTSAYGAMRGITYDPVRDGFWVIGNWSGNLTLIDRTGAIQQTGPAPTSASDLAYYKDDSGVEHVYCFNNGTNDVDDWVIGNGSMGSSVFNFSSTPGFASGSSGGCTAANFNGKMAFIGNIQQSPNLIGIYELGEAQGGGGSGSVPFVAGQYNIFFDGEWIGATAETTFLYTCEDAEAHEYCVVFVDENYNFSCEACIEVIADPLGVGQYNVVNAIYPNPTSGNLYITTNADMKSISIVNVLGQVVYNKAAEGTETIIDMTQFGNGIYMVNIVTENGTSVNRIIVNK